MSKKKDLDMLVLCDENGVITLLRKDRIEHIYVLKHGTKPGITVYAASLVENELRKFNFPLTTPTLDNLYSLTQEYGLNPELFEDEQGS